MVPSHLVFKHNQNLCFCSERRNEFDVGGSKVVVTTNVVDVSWMGPSSRQIIAEASVLVLLVESLSELHEMISYVLPCLNDAYPEPHMIPPFICFTNFTQKSDASNSDQDTTVSHSDEEDIEHCFLKLDLRVGIKVISVTEYLNQLKMQLYHQFCQKWRIEDEESDSGSLQNLSDPFDKTVHFLKRGLMVRYK